MSKERKSVLWKKLPKTNVELIRDLKKRRLIKSEEVENAMLIVDRGDYIPNPPENPYLDTSQSLGFASTISPPSVHAQILESLKDHLKNGQKALVVGNGSGYLATCMAVIMGENGVVFAIDHIPELIELATKNIQNCQPDLLPSGKIKLLLGDGRKGYPEMAPFDVIYVGAYISNIPQALLLQLKVGGRLIVPIGVPGSQQNVQQIDKLADGTMHKENLFQGEFVPLTDKTKQAWHY